MKWSPIVFNVNLTYYITDVLVTVFILKSFFKTVLFCLLASTPCLFPSSALAATAQFSVELAKWHIAKGDTLSEIAQKLLPNNKPLREKLMYKILELNPIAFPSNNIDFMLAYNTLFFPSVIDGVNIHQLMTDNKKLADKIKSPLQEEVKEQQKAPLYVAPEEIKTEAPKPEKTKVNRFYSLSEANLETDIKGNAEAFNNYQYITDGKKFGKVDVTDGPNFLLEPNTRIKVNIHNNQCQINLVYGLLRVLEKKQQIKHCAIRTQVAQLSAVNSAFLVKVCKQHRCLVTSKTMGEASLPNGLYYGVVKGTINVTDKSNHYKVPVGKIYYYNKINNKPLLVKYFKGLLFNDKDLASIEKNQSHKKKFAWGTIESHPQDEDYIDPSLEFITDYSDIKTKKTTKASKPKPLPESNPEVNGNSETVLERFN